MTNNTKIYYYKNFMDDKANISTRNQNEMCDLAYSFREYYPIVFVCLFSWILSLLTLFFLYWIWKCKEMRRVYSLSGLDLKIIILTALTCYTASALNTFLFYLYKSILLFLDLSKCTYIWTAWSCYIPMFYYQNVCTGIYLWLHISLFVERSLVTLNQKGRICCDGFIGAILCAATLTYSIYPQVKILGSMRSILNDRIYCSKMTTSLDNVTYVSHFYFNCGLDSFLALLGLVLYFINKKQIGFYKSHLNDFNLQHSFNLRAMRISMLYIFPFTILHSLAYWFNMLMHFLYANVAGDMTYHQGSLIFELVNFSRIVGSCLMFGFLWFYARMRCRRVDTVVVQNQGVDMYFDHFRQMIS